MKKAFFVGELVNQRENSCIHSDLRSAALFALEKWNPDDDQCAKKFNHRRST